MGYTCNVLSVVKAASSYVDRYGDTYCYLLMLLMFIIGTYGCIEHCFTHALISK
jgi:hypothetical protein